MSRLWPNLSARTAKRRMPSTGKHGNVRIMADFLATIFAWRPR
jgi:hypothetical protein